MKIKLLNFVKGLLVICIGLFSQVTLGQNPQIPNVASSVTLSPDISGLSVGDIVHIPVRLTTQTGPNQPIASAGIFVDYSQSVLSPLGPDGYTPTFAGVFTYNPFYSTNRLYLAWESSTGNNVTLSNTQIATLDFIYTGGTSTTMHLRRAPDVGNLCSFISATLGTVPISSFVDNTVSGAATGTYTLHSLAVGGPMDWNDQFAWQEGKTPSIAADVIITGEEMQIFVNDPNYPFTPTCNNLTINPTGHLTVNTAVTFAVAGNMDIQGDATGTGSFIDLGITTVSGTTTVQRFMTGNWVYPSTTYQSHLVSSPVASQSNNIFDGSLMNKWNEVTQNWDPLTLPYIIMGVGTGYAVGPVLPGITATFSGVLNTGNKNIGVTNTGAATFTGYNLLGNPYPSAINWDAGFTIPPVVDPIAWVWNGAGSYISYTQAIGGVIGAEQGFFVHATGTGTVTFTNDIRTHSPYVFFKSTINDLLTLKVEGNDFWDQTQLHVNSLSTAGYEAQYDATKLMGSPDAPQIYSMLPDEQLSINSVPDLIGSPVIQFGFSAGSVNNFTLTASGIELFASSTEFYLEDLVANKVQNLRTSPVYNFAAAPGEPEHRFNLHFSPVGIQDNKTASGIKIYSSEKTVYVNIATELKGNIVIYNMLGSEITRTGIQSLSINKINLDVPSGFYLVKVDGDSNTSTAKVFIR